MKPPLLSTFLILATTVGVLGQTCERTLTVSFLGPEMALTPQDFEATLDRKILQVTKVEPLRSSRILILLAAGDSSRLRDRKDFEKVVTQLSEITDIPENTSLAYGLHAKRISFSKRFTSDAEELRNSLEELVRQAQSGALGRGLAPDQDCLLGPALDFFGQSQPGDSIVEIGGGVTFCGPDPNNWAYNGAEGQRRLLSNGIRRFGVAPNCRECPTGYTLTFNGTGGRTGILGDKEHEAATWQLEKDFWLHGISRGYLVTVAVPTDAKPDRESWHLTLGASGRNRLGIPAKAPLLISYPDLLLCVPRKGLAQFASADRTAEHNH
jgi:hypothetical protein